MKRTQNDEKGYESALGMNYEDLTKQWHKYLKKRILARCKRSRSIRRYV